MRIDTAEDVYMVYCDVRGEDVRQDASLCYSCLCPYWRDYPGKFLGGGGGLALEVYQIARWIVSPLDIRTPICFVFWCQ